MSAQGWSFAAKPLEEVPIEVPGICALRYHDQPWRRYPPPAVLDAVDHLLPERPVSRAPGDPVLQSYQALRRSDHTAPE
jgi:hypothetical protein